MRRLSRQARARIISLLVEGVSLRATSRIEDVSINTVTKLLVDAGRACHAYHDEHVRNVRPAYVQADEFWAFIYCKDTMVERARRPPPEAGSIWTWLAMDADSKLMISWLVGPRINTSARALMQDLAGRVATRFQLTTDGLNYYRTAVEEVFGADIDYAQLIKEYQSPHDLDTERRYSPPKCTGTFRSRVMGNPDMAHVSTSYIERQNLTARMQNRRFTRLTNAFSRKLVNLACQVALHVTWHNWVRIHKTLRVTPAMHAGLTDRLRDIEWIVSLVEARDSQPGPRGPYRRRGRTPAAREE